MRVTQIVRQQDWPDIPSSAFSLTCGGRNKDRFILDTQFGIVYWLDTPDQHRETPIKEPSLDGEVLEICLPENEHNWRSHTAWAISDFSEVLEHEFKLLRAVPIEQDSIKEWVDGDENDLVTKTAILTYLVRRTYQMYNWPDLSLYDKDSCQNAVERLVESRSNASRNDFGDRSSDVFA